jgi:hypothetical protein
LNFHPFLTQNKSQSLPVASEQSRSKPVERSRQKGAEHQQLAKPIAPAPTDTSAAGLPLIGVRTVTCDWSEEMELNWSKTLTFGDLRLLRDFCKEGMQVTVVEEKVCSEFVFYFVNSFR